VIEAAGEDIMQPCTNRDARYFQFDAAYVDDLRNGRAATAEHFCNYFSNAIERSLRHRACGRIDDVRQETFLRVFRALRRPGAIQNPECFGAYVVSVARYVLMEMQREQTWCTPGESDTYSDTNPDPEAVASSAETRDQFMRALATLPDRDRKLLSLFVLDEKGPDEISRELHVRRSNVPVLLHRARRRLRSRMQNVARSEHKSQRQSCGTRGASE
jgi:RNA polymerase sigma factor (sigma-70 family)